MGIKGAEWAEPCRECGALDGCCATAKARRETANTLSRLVDRQRVKITDLEHTITEKEGVIADLRRKYEGVKA